MTRAPFATAASHVPQASPEVPARPQESPRDDRRKPSFPSQIAAYPRSSRNRQDRPVTPEVAGSTFGRSRKAPANRKALRCPIGCKRPPASPHLARIAHAESPPRAGPTRRSAGGTPGPVAGRPPTRSRKSQRFPAICSWKATPPRCAASTADLRGALAFATVQCDKQELAAAVRGDRSRFAGHSRFVDRGCRVPSSPLHVDLLSLPHLGDPLRSGGDPLPHDILEQRSLDWAIARSLIAAAR